MNALVPVTPAMTVSDVERVATAIAKGGLFGSKDPYAVLTLCLLAQAEGQHPAVVFRDYHIIQGKPAKKAEAMLRDFINAGGKVKWHTLDDTCADATFMHPSGEARIEWTLERAKKAGISTPMWSKYPRQMLRSRVISEGIRTVYPGATSGLYEEHEVRDITGAPAVEATATEETHDIETGEVQPIRQKVPGIVKIKQRLGAMMTAGNAITDFAEWRKLVHENRDDIKTIRDAEHEWWTGDGDDWEGFGAWMEGRYAALTPAEESASYQLLMSILAECNTPAELQNLIAQHGDAADALDGEESRKFQAAFDAREAGLHAVEVVNS